VTFKEAQFCLLVVMAYSNSNRVMQRSRFTSFGEMEMTVPLMHEWLKKLHNEGIAYYRELNVTYLLGVKEK